MYVCPFGIEELLEAIDGDLLTFVYNFATTIVTLTGIPFGILIGHAATHSLHYLFAYEVLRGDELNAFHLALVLFLDEVEDDVVFVHI